MREEEYKRCIFFDEQPWTFYSWRRFGHSQVNHRAIAAAPPNAGSSHTLALAICPFLDLVHEDFWVGGTTADTHVIPFVQAFCVKFGVQLRAHPGAPISADAKTILLDNASPHRKHVR